MVPITAADEELFSTAIVAARFGRIDAIIERLRTRYDQEWDDPLAGFPYALSMFALLQSGREDLLEQFNFTEIIETLSDLLYHEPAHWLGRYLRIHARTLLPADSEYRSFIAAERDRAMQDAVELIERQGRVGWQPWFPCTHILAARLTWQANPDDRDQMAAQVRAATARPGAPVPFQSLGSVMCSAFLWYRSQPGLPERAAVGALMGSLFPYNPTARRERADRAA